VIAGFVVAMVLVMAMVWLFAFEQVLWLLEKVLFSGVLLVDYYSQGYM